MFDYIKHYEEMINWHTDQIEWYNDQICDCNRNIKESQDYADERFYKRIRGKYYYQRKKERRMLKSCIEMLEMAKDKISD